MRSMPGHQIIAADEDERIVEAEARREVQARPARVRTPHLALVTAEGRSARYGLDVTPETAAAILGQVCQALGLESKRFGPGVVEVLAATQWNHGRPDER